MKDKRNRKSKFEVPSGYFDKMREKVSEQTAQEIANAAFRVPEHYFDEMRAAVNAEVHSEDDVPVIPLWRRNWFHYSAVAVAASIILLFIISPFEKECQTFACLLENSELQSEDLLFIEESEIESFYLEQIEIEEFTENEEEIYDYLIEEDVSLDELLEEYESN